MEKNNAMLTSAELRKEIPMPVRTMYYRIANGTIPPPVKIGGTNYWRAEDINLLKNGQWPPSEAGQDSQTNPA